MNYYQYSSPGWNYGYNTDYSNYWNNQGYGRQQGYGGYDYGGYDYGSYDPWAAYRQPQPRVRQENNQNVRVVVNRAPQQPTTNVVREFCPFPPQGGDDGGGINPWVAAGLGALAGIGGTLIAQELFDKDDNKTETEEKKKPGKGDADQLG